MTWTSLVRGMIDDSAIAGFQVVLYKLIDRHLLVVKGLMLGK